MTFSHPIVHIYTHLPIKEYFAVFLDTLAYHTPGNMVKSCDNFADWRLAIKCFDKDQVTIHPS